jgi:hypothetical protein
VRTGRSAQAEEAEHSADDNNEADDVDDGIHGDAPEEVVWWKMGGA